MRENRLLKWPKTSWTLKFVGKNTHKKNKNKKGFKHSCVNSYYCKQISLISNKYKTLL